MARMLHVIADHIGAYAMQPGSGNVLRQMRQQDERFIL
jgi:hypothetical protein